MFGGTPATYPVVQQLVKPWPHELPTTQELAAIKPSTTAEDVSTRHVSICRSPAGHKGTGRDAGPQLSGPRPAPPSPTQTRPSSPTRSTRPVRPFRPFRPIPPVPPDPLGAAVYHPCPIGRLFKGGATQTETSVDFSHQLAARRAEDLRAVHWRNLGPKVATGEPSHTSVGGRN